MDLQKRKYNFIEELIQIDDDRLLDALENVLKREKEEHQDISNENKKELDDRLEMYKNNPNNLIDWEIEKNNW